MTADEIRKRATWDYSSLLEEIAAQLAELVEAVKNLNPPQNSGDASTHPA